MGVKNLIKWIEKYAPNAIQYKKINKYKNKKIGFDANLLIYKIVYGIRVNGYDIKNNKITVTHIHSLLLKFMQFLKYSITPIFVFDSGVPEIKYNAIEKRKINKNKLIEKYHKSKTKKGKRINYYVNTDITHQEIQECKTLMEIFGYNVIDAKEEADSQLVQLYDRHIIDYIASDDMDILLFGAGQLLKNFTVNSNKYIQEIDLNKILQESQITMDEFVRIGILHGTDYCDQATWSPVTAYQAVINCQDNVIKNCKHAYNYFFNPPVHDIKKAEIQFTWTVNFKELKKFLVSFEYQDDYVKNIIRIIKNNMP
jgi:5'-3' exonuclease